MVRVARPDDLIRLQGTLDQMQGEAFLRADVLYGDELCLEIGEPRDYRHPRLAGEKAGSWSMMTQASSWTLRSVGGALLATSDDVSVATEQFQHLGRATVAACTVTYPRIGMHLLFSGGEVLEITRDHDPDSDLHNWVVFTPAEEVLLGGPGGQWAYGPAD